MAYVTNWNCKKCGKHQHSSEPTHGMCYDCNTAMKDRERREYFGRLNALTLEERIREIEEWIHDHKKKYHPRKELRF